ncbi:MAG: class I SAM-dependent methyltransferase [Cytophagales bacterium]|nr:class I SAM-dependent methyltransferase [Bernardetiaceae bacterium]MDW8205593.1 class I SAM-dependent methyltransferase [Cytophagales bacterium]
MDNLHNGCLICQSPRLQRLERYYAKDYLVKCQQCGFVFAQKIPSLQELEAYYEGYGRNDYLSPITVKRYEELLQSWEGYRQTNRLLDVGCGVGYFLETAKKKGWQVYGTEYTERAVAICAAKGITMQKGELNPALYTPESFDIITSFEVMEHICQPREEVAKFKYLLRKGGIVYITTPNFNSTLRYYLQEHYNIIAYPEHLSYYTPATLQRLMETMGFKKIWIRTTGISPMRLMSSLRNKRKKESNAIGLPAELPPVYVAPESPDERLRQSFESSLLMNLAKHSINRVLSWLGVGDSLKGLFVKV